MRWGFTGIRGATIDLDLWVAATEANAERIVVPLRAFGFDVPALEPSPFVNPASIVCFGTPPLRIELMVAIDGVEYEACRRNAGHFELDELNLP